MPSSNVVAFSVTVTSTPTALPSNPLQTGGSFTAGPDSAINLGNSPKSSSYLLESNLSAPFHGNNTNQIYVSGTGTVQFLGN